MPSRQEPPAAPRPPKTDAKEVLTYQYAKGYLPNPKHEEQHADGDRNV